MSKESQKIEKLSKKDEARLMAFIAAFFSIIGFVLAIATKRKEKLVMFYAGQSLIVFIFAVIVWIISSLVAWIPFIGELLNNAGKAIVITAWAISWIFALTGKKYYVPIIGRFSKKFSF